MADKLRVLGVDPGFASVGWAVADCDVGGEELVQVGLISSAPDKREADKQADRVARLTAIFDELWGVITFRAPRCIVVEDVGYVPDAGAMGKVAHVIGGVVALARRYSVPVTIIPPAAIKVALLGPAPKRKKGVERIDRKDAVAALMRRRHPYLAAQLEAFPAAKREHPTDALAVVRAALLLDTGLRRALQRGAE